MFILIVLAASLALALIRGGKIGNLAELKIRWSGVILIGFLIQVLIFSAYWQERSETQAVTQFAYLVSLGLLLTALTVNLRIPGMWLITFGFCLNFIVIALNGGHMPVAESALAVSGLPQLLPGQVSNNSIGIGPDTDRKSTRLNSSHNSESRMPSSA
jgi:hypothetical protein